MDTIVAAFDKGEGAEQIQGAYPTLNLADIYAVISYYLHHREQVKAYLSEQEAEAEVVRDKIEAHYPTTELRARMVALREQKRQQNA